MRPEIAKRLLGTLDLPDELIETVFADLEMMSRYKYDHYEMFAPGTRFLEHLYSWLKQFRPEHRQVALEFVRNHLIFVSQREMQDLARFLYFDLIVPEILETIIRDHKLGPFDYGTAFIQHFRGALRRCFFIGLSDGAKIDFFRRHHIDLSQEQVLPYYRASAEEYLRKLREDTGNPEEHFKSVFLIDDFTASGYTLAHEVEYSGERKKREIVGALQRVYSYHEDIIDNADAVYLCHYIATESAYQHVLHMAEGMDAYRGKLKCFAALLLPKDLTINPSSKLNYPVLKKIVEMSEEYYDESFEDTNTKKGKGIKFGFGQQGLPVVLYSNTPNNSLYLLWMDRKASPSSKGFSSLFRRINRHRAK